MGIYQKPDWDEPKKWTQIKLPVRKDLSVGTDLERALDRARQAMKNVANSEKEVTFWFRGSAVIWEESGTLSLRKTDGQPPFELKACIEG